MDSITLLTAGGFLVLGLAVGYFANYLLSSQKAKSLEQKAAQLLEEAKKEGQEKKSQLDRLEERLIKKEETLEKYSSDIRFKESRLEKEEKTLENDKFEVSELRKRTMADLEKIAGLTAKDALAQLMKMLEQSHQEEIVKTIQKLEKDRKEEIEKKSLEIITGAIQRYSRSHVADITTTSFQLPNEEIKGKIIGREGRNIRTLEKATGVELVIDEAPESIIISSFDPVRREIARMALEKLIKDGRIQPAKIEEKVEEARQELNKRMIEIGEQSALEVGIIDLPKELLQLLGKLHFRTSYGQNVLVHSVEMAHISGIIAAELKMNVETAKKGALLHDIGKAISHEVEGTHVELGRKILQKYGIKDEVVQAMEAHHEEYPFATPESFVVAAADIISAARPGARRDTVENYLKRLEELEKIASGFAGVKTVYALSAGREIRVFVVPEKIDDFGAFQLAKDIAHKIQTEMKYPGEIKVNVVRETRAVEYAR
ncbi:MAG: ribonuclease Y [Candidatus Harrisonbacteria bacterium RIFCSPLOWO2_02_FULL_41_13b]|uniref:Ribonuclease Y n=1 Tax=Candidatus Harrisonbacteria bacterium RIFCSPLOWO2_02_FULL_41_13b TaxID=1798409 RepID=A0A1G1ZTR9_9BACT|nr:MAG: ribonuclease Y [Candidatus Harrisonbacteria bacterium RIFCSPHIGHO2_02_FULL_40_20]OGY68123.1 MAG: ribonuclease Y [Candidatus Harrisonbacteria bacterium RIFCSPLOWO2_02_FULL_41_13b]